MACKFHAAMRNLTIPRPSPCLAAAPSPPPCSGAAALALASLAGQAEKADRFKQLNGRGRPARARIDLLNQVVVFNGNVVVTKGTMVDPGAARIEVRETPDGYHTAVAIGSPSQHATFRQKRDGVDEYIEGDAERLEYDGKSDVVRFVNNASVRRLRGANAGRRDHRQPGHLRQRHRGLQRHRRRPDDRRQPRRPGPRGADAQRGHRRRGRGEGRRRRGRQRRRGLKLTPSIGVPK